MVDATKVVSYLAGLYFVYTYVLKSRGTARGKVTLDVWGAIVVIITIAWLKHWVSSSLSQDLIDPFAVSLLPPTGQGLDQLVPRTLSALKLNSPTPELERVFSAIEVLGEDRIPLAWPILGPNIVNCDYCLQSKFKTFGFMDRVYMFAIPGSILSVACGLAQIVLAGAITEKVWTWQAHLFCFWGMRILTELYAYWPSPTVEYESRRMLLKLGDFGFTSSFVILLLLEARYLGPNRPSLDKVLLTLQVELDSDLAINIAATEINDMVLRDEKLAAQYRDFVASRPPPRSATTRFDDTTLEVTTDPKGAELYTLSYRKGSFVSSVLPRRQS